MITHSLQQGTPEWDEFRMNHFGSSEAAAMLGLSSKVTRNELLRMKRTGIAKEFSDWVQKNILDYGHEVEASARPLVEHMLGEELYPVTCSDGKISASCDGLTMLEDIAFEHKQWNENLAAAVADGILPEEYMPQCQQILMVTGAVKVIFVVSDGSQENFIHVDVLPDQAWFEKLRAGWAQFEMDLENYQHVETKPEVIGLAPESLPALRIEVSGAVTASNLNEFKVRATEVFNSIKTELETDTDFANADKTTKWCKEVEDRLEAAKQHALSQTSSIDELFRTIDAIKEEARQKRLTLEKLVKQRKETIRADKVEISRKKFTAHVSTLQAEVSGVNLVISQPDFGGAIKGLKTLTSIQNELDTTLANAIIAADAYAKDVREKLSWCKENAAGHSALFPDLQALITKPMEDFTLTISSRIEQHKKAEADRLEAERERIRQEEAAKLAAAQQPEIKLSTAPALQPVAEVARPAIPATAMVAAENSQRGSPTLRLGVLNEKLGFSVTTDFLRSLGFAPHSEGAAKLYHDDDFPLICRAIVKHIEKLI
jgi:predicted phage-related endonuclease